MSTFRSALRYAWIPPVAWLLSVPVAELSFRKLGVRVAQTIGGIYEPFGDGSFRNRGGAHEFLNWYSGAYSVYTDSLGFRVGAHEADVHGAGWPEVLVLGDSQAFGQGVEYEDSVVGVFQARATSAGISVADAAVNSHSLRNQVELAEWLLNERALKPRVVLVSLTSRNVAAPAFYMRAFVHDGSLYNAPPSPFQLVRSWISTHSAAYLMVRNTLRGLMATESTPEFLQIYETSHHGERLQELSGIMARLQNDLAPIHARLAFVYMPLVVESALDDQLARMAKPGQHLSAREPRALAEELAESLHAPLVDLTPAIQQARMQNAPLSLRGDDHYSQSLSKACGDRIYTALDWTLLTNTGSNP